MKKIIIPFFALSLVIIGCNNNGEADASLSTNGASNEYDDLQIKSLHDRVSYAIGFTSAGEMKEYAESEQYSAYFNKLNLKEGFYKGIQSLDTAKADECNSTLMRYFSQPGVFDTTEITPNIASNSLGFLSGIEIHYSLTKRGLFEQLSADLIKKGFKDALYNYDTLIPIEDQVNLITDFFGSLVKKEGEAFLEQNKLRPEVTTSENGLQIETLVEGKGKYPTLNSTVSVYYTLTLTNGKTVESNVNDPEPVSFPLSNVIQGWQQGLQMMKKGGTYKLYVPYELGYGHQGSQGIQPYSALLFEIQLVDFK
jgi:FKBP-type peptidyl-prolyl cis-trans isomerase FklB